MGVGRNGGQERTHGVNMIDTKLEIWSLCLKQKNEKLECVDIINCRWVFLCLGGGG